MLVWLPEPYAILLGLLVCYLYKWFYCGTRLHVISPWTKVNGVLLLFAFAGILPRKLCNFTWLVPSYHSLLCLNDTFARSISHTHAASIFMHSITLFNSIVFIISIKNDCYLKCVILSYLFIAYFFHYFSHYQFYSLCVPGTYTLTYNNIDSMDW